MIIQISGVNVNYAEGKMSGVHVNFSGHDEQRSIHLSGYVPLTAKEYQDNESMDALQVVVRKKLNEKLDLANVK
ncbi:hypothetical protein [Virgibacillus sp. MG-45]|uniref:hypothetical protein n=1 Tax=Virgibacillus sp. MG-45 TaxID=3102791 RepID=UPI002EDA23B0